MIIVHAYHHYYPVIGGMERAVQGLAEAQAKLGNEVYVVTSTIGSQQRPFEEIINDVHIFRVKSWRLHYPDLTIPKFIPFEILKKADIVHVHSHNSLFSIKILDEASKLGIKTACYFMAVDAFGDHPNLLVRLLAPYYGKRNAKRALNIANLPLVKSLRDMEILKKNYGVEAKYLPDAVSDYYFTIKKANATEFREKFKINHDKFFLFLGRIHKLKGPHILVKALEYTDRDIAAVFVGPDGGYLKEMLELAQKINVRDRVYVLGYLEEETKIQAIDSSIALIVPSIIDYVEVYPMAVSEAWARGKPVIASKTGGLPYRVKSGFNGLLFDPSNPKMLAEAMLKIASDEELAKVLGRNGKKDVFTWKEIATKSIELYTQALENN